MSRKSYPLWIHQSIFRLKRLNAMTGNVLNVFFVPYEYHVASPNHVYYIVYTIVTHFMQKKMDSDA